MKPVDALASTLSRRSIAIRGLGALALALTTAALPPGSANAAVALKEVAAGFTSPVLFEPLTDGSGHALIGDQIGTLHVLKKSGELSDALFLDLRDRLAQLNDGKFDERGLLGLALHPKFKQNGKFYVCYSAPLREGAPRDWNHTSHLSEFKVAKGSPLKAAPGSERVLLRIDQPQFNHDGGRLAFGPDGYLYLGTGDGGNKNDEGLGHPPGGNAQRIDNLLGKILRIDVDSRDSGLQYGIPGDNPFVGKKGRDEIYAYGFRNPWGISFDMGGDHRLFAADVGQNMFEEVNLVKKGGNHGWRLREGFHGFDPGNPVRVPDNAAKKGPDGEPFVDPILEYLNFKGHNSPRYKDQIRGISVTGGYVYRGKALPKLNGQYIFADWSKNWGFADGYILAAKPPQSGDRWELRALNLAGKRLGAYVTALGQDLEGEIYIMTNDSNTLKGKTGQVLKLVPGAAGE